MDVQQIESSTTEEDHDRGALQPIKNENGIWSPRTYTVYESEGSDKSFSSSISSLGHHGTDFEIDMPKLRDCEETQDCTVDGTGGQDNDDETAMMMSKILSTQSRLGRKESTFGISLLKRATIIESIKWLGRHVPGCALNEICQHVFNLANKSTETTPMVFPHVSRYSSALLFIDMSGFTKLSQHLDVESLSKVSLSIFRHGHNNEC